MGEGRTGGDGKEKEAFGWWEGKGEVGGQRGKGSSRRAERKRGEWDGAWLGGEWAVGKLGRHCA